MCSEVVPVTSSEEHKSEWSYEYENLPTEELARRQGVRPMTREDLDAFGDPDLWGSDEEFLADLYASRRANLG